MTAERLVRREARFLVLSALLMVRPLAGQQGTGQSIPLTIEAGVPLHVVLDKRVPIKKRVGTPIRAHLAEPIYVFDRMVIPAGTEVDGRISRVETLPRKARVLAMLNGNFTPQRKAEVTFDTVVLKNGRRLPMETVVSPGVPRAIHLETAENGKQKKKSAARSKVDQAMAEARQRAQAQRDQVVQNIKSPGRIHRLKSALVSRLESQSPYRPQAFPEGTTFIAELKQPVAFGSEDDPPDAFKSVGAPVPPGSLVHATLATALSSAKDHVGATVEAVLTRPVLTEDQHLILPQGTRLEGIVTAVRPAKRWGRNGELRFTFRQVELPSRVKQAVEASLEGVEADKAANLKLDSEGGAHAVTSKKQYVAPVLEVMLAMGSMDHRDHDRADVQDATNGGTDVGGSAVRGGVGLGFAGSIIALVARSRAVSAGFAFYGAGWSVYSHFVERGRDVVFAKNTPIEIRFGTHGRPVGEPKADGIVPSKFVSSATEHGAASSGNFTPRAP